MCWDQPLKRICAASTLGKPQKLSSSWNRSRSQTKVVRFFQSTHATIGLSLPSLALLELNTVIYVEFGYLRGTFSCDYRGICRGGAKLIVIHTRCRLNWTTPRGSRTGFHTK